MFDLICFHGLVILQWSILLDQSSILEVSQVIHRSVLNENRSMVREVFAQIWVSHLFLIQRQFIWIFSFFSLLGQKGVQTWEMINLVYIFFIIFPQMPQLTFDQAYDMNMYQMIKDDFPLQKGWIFSSNTFDLQMNYILMKHTYLFIYRS